MTYFIIQPPYPSILYSEINSIYIKIKFLPIPTLKSNEISKDIACIISRKKTSIQSIDPNLGLHQKVKLRKNKEKPTHLLRIPTSGRPSRPPPPNCRLAGRLAGRRPPGRRPPGRGLAGRPWPARADPSPRGERERKSREEKRGREIECLRSRWDFFYLGSRVSSP